MERVYCPYALKSTGGRQSWCSHCTFRRQSSLSLMPLEGLPCELWMPQAAVPGGDPALVAEGDDAHERLIALRTTRQVGPQYLATSLI